MKPYTVLASEIMSDILLFDEHLEAFLEEEEPSWTLFTDLDRFTLADADVA